MNPQHVTGSSTLPPSPDAKLRCPHCERFGISPGAKRRSSHGWPAKCVECGGLVHGAGLFAAFCRMCFEGLIAPLAIFAVFFFLSEHRYFLAAAFAAAVYLAFLLLKRFADTDRIWPITPERSVVARRLVYAFILISVACVILFLIFHRNA